MENDEFFINEETFLDHEMINLYIPPVANFIDDELEKGIIQASLKMGYEINEERLKKWIERCIKLDNLSEDEVKNIALRKKFIQLKNKIERYKRLAVFKDKWQKLKEWLEEDIKNKSGTEYQFILDEIEGERLVLDQMQELEGEDE